MTQRDNPGQEVYFANDFSRVPPNEDVEVRSWQKCNESGAYRRRQMKRFIFPPSLLMVKPLDRKTAKTHEGLSLFELLQQQMRDCRSLTDNDEVMKYKRSNADGRRDWVRFIEGTYCTDAICLPSCSDSLDWLQVPLLSRREHNLSLENVPKKECISPFHVSSIAPIHSSMWFDLENFKNVCSSAMPLENVLTFSGITEEYLGIAKFEIHSNLPGARRDSSIHVWHTKILSEYILAQLSEGNQQGSFVSALISPFPIRIPSLSSTGSHPIAVSNFVQRKCALVPSLADLQKLSETIRPRSAKIEAKFARPVFRENDGWTSFQSQGCVDDGIEKPILRHYQRKAESEAALNGRMYALTETKWKPCFALACEWEPSCMKDFCSQTLIGDERWHEGPRGILAKCNQFDDPRTFDFFSECELLFQSFSLSVSTQEMVSESLEKSFRLYRANTNHTLDMDYASLFQSAQASSWEETFTTADFTTATEPQYDLQRKVSSGSLELKIFPMQSYLPWTSSEKSSGGLIAAGESPPADKPNADVSDDQASWPCAVEVDGDGLFDIPGGLATVGSYSHLQSFESFAHASCEVGQLQEEIAPELPSSQKPESSTYEQDVENSFDEGPFVKIPEKMTCRPWILKLARKCILEQHAAIYLPSPLSCLPSLCIVAHTLLSRIDEDFRILVFCTGKLSMLLSVKSYFNDIVGGEHLVTAFSESFSDIEVGDLRRIEKSRIVVTNSAGDAVAWRSFSILFLLLDCSSVVGGNDYAQMRTDMLSRNLSWGEQKKMMFIAPYQSVVSCADFHIGAQTLVESFRIRKAIVCNSAHDEIRPCLDLSRPETVLLVPSRSANNGLAVIDNAATPVLNYIFKSANFAERNTLKSMTPSLLERRIDETIKHKDVQQQKALMELHTLRHARSFVLYDGISAAISYLRSNFRRLDDRTSQRLLDVLQALENESEQEKTSEKKCHPFVKAIRKLLLREEGRMREEERSVKSLWMCQEFSPLIITESEVMMSGIMNGLDSVIASEIAEPGDIAVCLLESTRTAVANTGLQQINRYARYSHVVYLCMDKVDEDLYGSIPLDLLHLWFSSGLRLIFCTVDETRALEETIFAGEEFYERMRGKIMGGSTHLVQSQPFVTTDIPHRTVRKTAPEVTDVDDIENVEQNHLSDLRFSECDILSFGSIAQLRNVILDNVARRQSAAVDGKVTLHAQITSSHENSAVARIACAMASDEKLRGTVSLRFTFN